MVLDALVSAHKGGRTLLRIKGFDAIDEVISSGDQWLVARARGRTITLRTVDGPRYSPAIYTLYRVEKLERIGIDLQRMDIREVRSIQPGHKWRAALSGLQDDGKALEPSPAHATHHPKHIPSRIHRARLASGMTRTELAERVGVSRQFLTRIEEGKAAPSVARLCELCDALGIEPGVLLMEVDG